MMICPSSGDKPEIVPLHLAKIWQPWYANFGNSETKNMNLEVFDDAYTGSKVNFDFQGCHLLYGSDILLIYVNPEWKIT